jgi:N-methylhydantoinase B
VLAPAKVSLKFERGQCPPWGLAGGHEAATCFVEIRRIADGSVARMWKGTYELHPGDRLRVVSGGGGGYGPPEAREPERVRQDVVQGYVSREQAREAYRVALTENLDIDVPATRALRA